MTQMQWIRELASVTVEAIEKLSLNYGLLSIIAHCFPTYEVKYFSIKRLKTLDIVGFR